MKNDEKKYYKMYKSKSICAFACISTYFSISMFNGKLNVSVSTSDLSNQINQTNIDFNPLLNLEERDLFLMLYVEEGQHVQKGDELLEFWDPTIKQAGLDDTVIMTVTNSTEFTMMDWLVKLGQAVKATDNILQLHTKA